MLSLAERPERGRGRRRASPACSGPSRASSTTRTRARRRADLRIGYWEEPWAIDAPAAEQNLSRRLRTVTSIEVTEPVVITLDDEKIWQHPWLYIVEPSNLVLSDKEAATLREFLLRGGTLTLDDFHGPYEWDLTDSSTEADFSRIATIVEIEPPHPIYSCFYKLDKYPQVPGLGSFFQGRTWEKGGFVRALARHPRRHAAGRWCSSTGTPTWATASSGRTPRIIPAI